jgi:phosphoglycolate phosphatase-like HAD superfamily hydrolase
MTRVLLLWDVDDTLIAGGGVNEEIYELAFTLLTGRPPETRFPIAGFTERGLLDRMMTVNGLDPAAYPWPDQHAALVEACTRHRENLGRRGHVLPGVPAALAAVAARPEVISSLLTGNCAENARTKLGVFGLDSSVDLEVGGYGSDTLVRGELVAIAQAKAAARDGFDPARAATVLVGDTPLDVEAGLTGGAWVVGVGTGRFAPSELRSAGADEVVADLADLDGFLAVLDRLHGRGPVGPRPVPGP